MATADEVLAMAEVTETSKVLTIDNDLRTISIPGSVTILGVESDDDVRRLHFSMPKTYGEFDLSTFAVRINYLNANNEGDVYAVTDAKTEGDAITFSWLVGRTAAAYKGDVRFIVCLKRSEDGEVVQEFNTTVASLPVLEGLETTEAVVQTHPDVLENILKRLDDLEQTGGVSDEQIGNAVNAYLSEHPVEAGATAEQAAQIQKNKEDIETLKQTGTGQPGQNGEDGEDGYSPTVAVATIAGGHRVSITDKNGTKTFDVMDGQDGTDGDNGVSPTITVTTITGGHRVTITDVNGAQSFDVADGKDGTGGTGGTGTDGEDGGYYTPSVDDNGNLTWSASKAGMPSVPSANVKGADGTDGEDGVSVTHSWSGTTLTITSKSGTSSADLKGEPGKDGKDGKDYVLSDADKQEIAEAAAELVEVPEGGGSSVELDTTLTQSGKAADAKATGDALNAQKEANAKQDKSLDDINTLLKTITLGKHSDGLIYVFLGGQPMGTGMEIGGEVVEPVYGDPTTDTAILKLTVNQTAQLGVKLDAQPNVTQTVTVLSNSEYISFDKTELTFTPDNWNEFQYVTVTTGTFEDDTNANIILRNSDPLMTDTNIQVYLQADMYSVDMTIPEGQYTVQASDFERQISGNLFIATKYVGTNTNIYIPNEIEENGTTYTFMSGNMLWGSMTGVEYIELADDMKNSGFNFLGLTALIGVKFKHSAFGSSNLSFKGCTSFKWWNGIESTVISNRNIKTLFQDCTALEYIPDLSHWTVTDMTQMFNNTGLKKIYGMPVTTEGTSMNSCFYNSQISSAVVPAGVTDLFYAFAGCPNLRKVTVYAENVTRCTSAFNNDTDVTVYLPEGTTTYETANAEWGGNSEVTILGLGGGQTPTIVTWGDSTTSEGTSWTCWPDRLIAKLGTANFALRNEAVSGEYTTSTSARQGGNTIKILEEFTIPADTTAVTIPKFGTRDGRVFGASTNSAGNFRPYESFNPCTIAGVSGTFTNYGGYKFTRMSAGEAVTVPAGTYVYSDQDDALNNENVIMLINLGINSGWEEDGSLSYYAAPPIPEDLVEQMQLMIDHFTAKGGTRYIVCGPCAGKFLETEVNRAKVLEFEALAATAFGDHWLNLRQYMIDNGLTENGLTATAEDTERMANNLVPMSLLGGNGETDTTHPNAYGANSQMLAFYNKGVALGYWT